MILNGDGHPWRDPATGEVPPRPRWRVEVRTQIGPRGFGAIPLGPWYATYDGDDELRARRQFGEEERKGMVNASSSPYDPSWIAREVRLLRDGEVRLHVHWNMR